ncbi:uncharacterized protein LOC114305972 [Camellia sinensis]|uniref:uncharacterized protein LOC114305972 n=1 Tax=Camellia sinensis TaxID=4442 RepID=UPI00103655FB|nr:uncharacterized protein LOC114305972 [Camellia sinensis]
MANNPSEFTKGTSSLDAFAQAIDSVSYASLNPPSVPTLVAVKWASWLRRFAFIVDWHNLGYTLLALSLGRSSVFVAIYHWFEKHFEKMANGSLCATKAMQHELAQNWGINAAVLYDQPPEFLLNWLIAYIWINITDLPFSLYSIFVIEARHGFIKQTIWLFIRDMIKGIILAIIIGSPIVATIIVIVQKGSPWPSIFGGFCLYYLL